MLFPKLTEVKDRQLLNTSTPKNVTNLGIIIASKDVQLQKAQEPILIRPLGVTLSFKNLQFMKISLGNTFKF